MLYFPLLWYTLPRAMRSNAVCLLCCLCSVVIMCMHSVLIGGQAQGRLLEAAHDLQMTDGSLVFVPYDTLLYSLPYERVLYPALRTSSKLREAYDAVLTITVESEEATFHQAYQEAVDRGELADPAKPEQVQLEHNTSIGKSFDRGLGIQLKRLNPVLHLKSSV